MTATLRLADLPREAITQHGSKVHAFGPDGRTACRRRPKPTLMALPRARSGDPSLCKLCRRYVQRLEAMVSRDELRASRVAEEVAE